MVDGMLAGVKQLTVNMLSESIQFTLATRRQTQLFEHTTQIVEALLLELLQKQQDAVRTIVACETHKPITYAEELLRSERENTTRKLMNERTLQRVNEYFDKLDAKTNKQTKLEDRKRKAADSEWVVKCLGFDSYSEEVKAMVTPISYYRVASLQMVDTIAKHLEYGFIYALESNLKDRLREKLQVMDTDHCAQLLAEDPHREETRRRLVVEKEKLLKAMDELRSLPQLR